MMVDDDIMDGDDTEQLGVDGAEIDAEDDPNSLGSILGKAVVEINRFGGRDRHLLAQVLGPSNYETLMAKAPVRKAADAWLEASPKSKKAAGKVLALQIAKVADEPGLVGRIQTEIEDAFADCSDTPTKERQPTANQVAAHRKAVTQKRNGQRVAYEAPKRADLHMLAKLDDGTQYIQARRRQQKENYR